MFRTYVVADRKLSSATSRSFRSGGGGEDVFVNGYVRRDSNERQRTSNSGVSSTQLHMAGSSDSGNQYYKGMNAYQILEVPRTADKKTIKAAYRKGTVTFLIRRLMRLF